MSVQVLLTLRPSNEGVIVPRDVSTDSPAKALLIAYTKNSTAVLASINKLTPEHLCLFLPAAQKDLVETELQPHITTMPQRWDWILIDDPHNFFSSHQVLAQQLPDLLKSWHINAGELVCDFSDATPGMAAALALVSRPMASRFIQQEEGETPSPSAIPAVPGPAGHPKWLEGNPWNEEAIHARQEAARWFNEGRFPQASAQFRFIETMASGRDKPLYHALANLADGYALWEQFQYRPAWDKLKTSRKTLDAAAMWGGPKELPTVLPGVKRNAEFLEGIVLDPGEVKQKISTDLLAHAKRRAHRDRHFELATFVLLRALEAFAQYRLWTHFHIKTWDVTIAKLPPDLQERCRTCFLDDIDGKYKLPFLAQFRTLAGLGDSLGQTFLGEWTKMKTLMDAAHQSILGHGFEPIKPERFHQLWDLVLKLTSVNDSSLPAFPQLTL